MRKNLARILERTLMLSVVVLATVPQAGCQTDSNSGVRAYAEGTFTIRAQPDSTKDFSGFEVLLVSQTAGDVDTLGIATTDMEGRFSMEILASEPGIYPLIVSRADTRLGVAEYVVADGDSATVTGSFPLDGRPLRISSYENSAWAAYRNAKYQHNESLLSLVQSQSAGFGSMEMVVARTSTILWSLRSTYPQSLASDLAAVESIVMLEGFDDSAVVDRFASLPTDTPTIVAAVKAARRSTARLHGLDSSLALIRRYQDAVTTDDRKAELQAELVVTYADSSRTEEALQAALELRRLYPDSNWAEWASRASYEFENLLPGMEAPPFSVVDTEGETVTLDDMRGRFLILEFFEPTNESFLKEYARRDTVFSSLNDRVFRTLSISLEPDSVINMALFDEGAPPGRFVFARGGREAPVARQFNVQVLPTRFLIDPDGLIVSKYPGASMVALAEDLNELYAEILENAGSADN